MGSIKKPITVVVLFTLMLFVVSASPYLGVSQGPVSTSVEVGFLTRSIDQNFTVSLPLLGALDSGDNPLLYPVASLNLLYKKIVGGTLAIGVGPTLRMGWEYEKTICLQTGLLLQFSLEAVGVRDILFCELAYLPEGWQWLHSPASSILLADGIGQYVRFGYRHAF